MNRQYRSEEAARHVMAVLEDGPLTAKNMGGIVKTIVDSIEAFFLDELGCASFGQLRKMVEQAIGGLIKNKDLVVTKGDKIVVEVNTSHLCAT